MNSGSSVSLRDIWGSSSSDVFAVGAEGTILHYNGNSWKSMDDNSTNGYYCIWGSSPSDVYAVTELLGVIYHYNGRGWSNDQRVTLRATLLCIWGSSANDIFTGGNGFFVAEGVILRYE
jgi:hypothetical protein